MKNTLRLVVGCALALNLISCGGGGGSSSTSTSSCSSGTAGTGSASVTTLGIVDNNLGSGVAAADGNTLAVYYTGWLYNSSDANNEGTEFDSNTTGTGFSFELGVGDVIEGWDKGLVGMQVGATRVLTIPSSMGYGTCPVAGSPIPPDAALVFSVQLLSITT